MFLFPESLQQMNNWTEPALFKSSRRMSSVKKVFWEISQNSQENTCVRVSATLLKKRLQHRCFPVNFTFCYRTHLEAASDFLKEIQ